MDHKKRAFFLIASISLLLIAIVACATQPVASERAQTETMAAQPETAVQQEAKPISPYALEVKPLGPAECGRCHSSVYNQIKNEGGKHQIECIQCHVKYHAYNPKKQNWEEIMPKCQICHGLIHGDKFADCMSCHSNPHAPKTQMIMAPEMAKVCADCHGKVAQEVQKNPSKHAKVNCSTCHHQKHGYIPSCMECHTPHTPNQAVKECLACHPVHSPLNIAYAQTTANSVCGACHSAVYLKLEESSGKHRMVACAQCHSKHKYIPGCEECHGKPHGEGLLKKFPKCSQCHVDVHDLPAIAAKK